MSLTDLLNQPVHEVVEYLKDKSDFHGEAIAKLAYQQLTRKYVCFRIGHNLDLNHK